MQVGIYISPANFPYTPKKSRLFWIALQNSRNSKVRKKLKNEGHCTHADDAAQFGI